jgi:hypothetical protein
MKTFHNSIRKINKTTNKTWLFGATLLGCVRDGKILDWDKDVDLGILSEHMTEELLAKFVKHGFRIHSKYTFDMPEMSPYFDVSGYSKIVLMSRDNTKIEICCFKKATDGRYYYASGTPRLFGLDADMIFPLKQVKFYDFVVSIPEESEKQLEFVYGADWRVPKKKWYFTKEHYLRREKTIIELKGDDGTKWSKWTGRKIINKQHD